MQPSSASSKIVHNSIWYGLETGLELLVYVGTSIAVARCLGPEKLGHYAAVSFPLAMINTTAGNGLATATRKYMTEFLGANRPDLARSVYEFTFKYQWLGASVVSALAIAIVVSIMPHGYKVMAALLALSILPSMMTNVPAQANLAFEDASKNTLSAFGYLGSYTAIVIASLILHWDLVGIASAMLVGRTLEVALRIPPVRKQLSAIAPATLPPELKSRIRRFCLQAVGVQVLTSIVWDKSELIVLAAFSSAKQIAYYSISAGLVANLLTAPRVFSTGIGVSLMAEAGRGTKKVASIVFHGVRFLGLIVLPIYLGAAAITKQAIWTAYGTRYMPAVSVMLVAVLFGIPRSFLDIPSVLMRAADRQNAILRCMILTAAFNIALDLLLIPRFGALGAAYGNGISQTLGIVLFWFAARKIYSFQFPFQALSRLAIAALGMATVALLIARTFKPAVGLGVALLVAPLVYMLLLRILRALELSDLDRLLLLASKLPRAARPLSSRVLQFVVPRHASSTHALSQASAG
ncbi:MAG TPA: polysaccharide biosynthesis C-terminal domain-containing protein [Terriglobales bacterium]